MPRLLPLYSCALLATLLTTQAHAGFTPFVIREGGGGPPSILSNNAYVPGATEFVIAAGGQKAGWGSNDINGFTIDAITNLSITRYDDTTRFTAGSGPAVAPYFNIWVTDGLGNFAVLANEPSNPDFQSLFVDNGDGSKSYNLSFADLADKRVQIYETPGGGYGATNTWIHQQLGLVGDDFLTFSDVASLKIGAPTMDYILDPINAVGTGAPREFGTNTAYGFNWVFGDSLSNYVSGMEGYVVSFAQAQAAVPEPSTIALTSLAGIGALLYTRRRRH